MIKNYLLLLLMLLQFFIGITQTRKLHFDHLNVRNGLPSDYVGQILQDEKGYIWLNTGWTLSRYDGYKFKSYKFVTKQDESELITKLFFDSNKRLWIGTQHGYLFHFDPVRDSLVPERYRTDNMKDIWVANYFSDKQNKIWTWGFDYKTKAFQLEQYDTKNKKTRTFTASQKGNEFLDTGILNSSFVTKSGDILFGTRNGLYEFDFKTGNFEHYLNSRDSLNSFSIVHFSENTYDTSLLWLLGKHLKDKQFTLYLFNRHDKTIKACVSFKGTLERFAEPLFEDRKGRLWLAFKEGLYQYNSQSNDTAGYLFPRSDKFVNEHMLSKIKDDTEGNIWLGTSFGVIYFDVSSGTFQRYMANPSDPDALAHNHVMDLFEDQSGLMWVGMDEYGVDRVNNFKSSFRTLIHNSLQPGTYPENTTGIVEGPDGIYWVTTQRGLFEWDTTKNYFKKITIGKKDENQFTRDPITFKKGTVYFVRMHSDGSRLDIYSPKGKLESFKLPGNDGIATIFSDSFERIWVFSEKGRLYQFDVSQHYFSPYSFVDISGKKVTLDTVGFTSSAFYEDSEGTLWISTSKAGLCRVDRVKRTIITSPSAQKSIFKDIICMYDDTGGNFWLGTSQNGLWLFDRKGGKLVKQITDKDGVLSRAIAGITEDSSGNLWVFSERGLTKFNYKNNALFNYTITNNIPFDVPVSITKTNSGELLLCMFNSVMFFNPDEIKPNLVSPIVQVENIVYSNPRSKQPDERLVDALGQTNFRLPYHHNRITFNFVALHYVNSLQNQYAYKLDGFDNNWVQSGTQHKVTYDNLDPGTYIFHVKASNSDGVWSTKDASITIIISPPWWKTWWAYLLFGLMFIGAIWAFIAYRTGKIKNENRMLEEKVTRRTKQLEQSISELKLTQKQLIQSEKMASLGELTAGIAHEIQNPLNFVNNFSEVNQELANELKSELAKGNMAAAEAIAGDIIQNEEKIIHHGKRADAIVKGMLQHSRSSSGIKEPTDINILADEYLRLAYHGLRAKDKSFNATMKTDFDENIGKINIVPQDIGRVLVNLINNAFYAVSAKAADLGKTLPNELATADSRYEPTVTISTKKLNDKVEIRVKDNGNGIPQKILDKIFQPFFTTKPTGQGTGLGLSLSYDIVKAHGGELKVETPPEGQAGKEVEGSEFIILLPINAS